MPLTAHDYELAELRFAYCYHAYLRCHTRWLRPYPPLQQLSLDALRQELTGLGVHVLEAGASPTDFRALVSLPPSEPLSACAGKVKGRASRWLRAALGLAAPEALLAKGYFACTSGRSTADQVERYLETQGEHHGYAGRAVPPVYVETYLPDAGLDRCVRAAHACTVLRFHLVLATWRRRGVFGQAEAQAVARRWLGLQRGERFALLKVSFVPDHVHVAVRVHRAVAPGPLAVVLMNAAQRVVWHEFAGAAAAARAERLWQPSAYVGSFGDLASPQVQAYLRRWQAEGSESAGGG